MMSEANFPGMMPTQDPPRGAPGSPNVQTPADREQLSIRLRMADAYKILASELSKPQPDPIQVIRARGMLQQIEAQRPQAGPQPMGAPSGGPFGGPRTGVPQPVDGRVDAMTGQPITPGSTR